MEASHIREYMSSESTLSSKVNEAMEVNTLISVTFSANDALSAKAGEVVDNIECIKAIALTVREESITGVKIESGHESKSPWVESNIIHPGTGTPRHI